MSSPSKCPVCEGRTTVPAGFYTPGRNGGGTETCRTCGGKGMVLAESATGGAGGSQGGDDPMDLEYRR